MAQQDVHARLRRRFLDDPLRNDPEDADPDTLHLAPENTWKPRRKPKLFRITDSTGRVKNVFSLPDRYEDLSRECAETREGTVPYIVEPDPYDGNELRDAACQLPQKVCVQRMIDQGRCTDQQRGQLVGVSVRDYEERQMEKRAIYNNAIQVMLDSVTRGTLEPLQAAYAQLEKTVASSGSDVAEELAKAYGVFVGLFYVVKRHLDECAADSGLWKEGCTRSRALFFYSRRNLRWLQRQGKSLLLIAEKANLQLGDSPQAGRRPAGWLERLRRRFSNVVRNVGEWVRKIRTELSQRWLSWFLSGLVLSGTVSLVGFSGAFSLFASLPLVGGAMQTLLEKVQAGLGLSQTAWLFGLLAHGHADNVAGRIMMQVDLLTRMVTTKEGAALLEAVASRMSVSPDSVLMAVNNLKDERQRLASEPQRVAELFARQFSHDVEIAALGAMPDGEARLKRFAGATARRFWDGLLAGLVGGSDSPLHWVMVELSGVAELLIDTLSNLTWLYQKMTGMVNRAYTMVVDMVFVGLSAVLTIGSSSNEEARQRAAKATGLSHTALDALSNLVQFYYTADYFTQLLERLIMPNTAAELVRMVENLSAMVRMSTSAVQFFERKKSPDNSTSMLVEERLLRGAKAGDVEMPVFLRNMLLRWGASEFERAAAPAWQSFRDLAGDAVSAVQSLGEEAANSVYVLLAAPSEESDSPVALLGSVPQELLSPVVDQRALLAAVSREIEIAETEPQGSVEPEAEPAQESGELAAETEDASEMPAEAQTDEPQSEPPTGGLGEESRERRGLAPPFMIGPGEAVEGSGANVQLYVQPLGEDGSAAVYVYKNAGASVGANGTSVTPEAASFVLDAEGRLQQLQLRVDGLASVSEASPQPVGQMGIEEVEAVVRRVSANSDPFVLFRDKIVLQNNKPVELEQPASEQAARTSLEDTAKTAVGLLSAGMLLTDRLAQSGRQRETAGAKSAGRAWLAPKPVSGYAVKNTTGALKRSVANVARAFALASAVTPWVATAAMLNSTAYATFLGLFVSKLAVSLAMRVLSGKSFNRAKDPRENQLRDHAEQMLSDFLSRYRGKFDPGVFADPDDVALSAASRSGPAAEFENLVNELHEKMRSGEKRS